MKLAPMYAREVEEKERIRKTTQAMLQWELRSKLDRGEEREFGLQLAMNDLAGINSELNGEATDKKWFWFDTVSGLIVVSNAFYIGYEAVQTKKIREDYKLFLYTIEIGYLLLFITELALRVMFGTLKVLL